MTHRKSVLIQFLIELQVFIKCFGMFNKISSKDYFRSVLLSYFTLCVYVYKCQEQIFFSFLKTILMLFLYACCNIFILQYFTLYRFFILFFFLYIYTCICIQKRLKISHYVLLSDYQTNKLRTSTLENVDVEYQKCY